MWTTRSNICEFYVRGSFEQSREWAFKALDLDPNSTAVHKLIARCKGFGESLRLATSRALEKTSAAGALLRYVQVRDANGREDVRLLGLGPADELVLALLAALHRDTGAPGVVSLPPQHVGPLLGGHLWG